MTIEVYIPDKQYLRQILSELNSILSKDINKQLIVNTFNFHIHSSTWPTDFYKIRDEVIPEVYGENVSKALFWCLFGGWMMEKENMKIVNETISKENYNFLNYMILTYTKTLIKAKNYNINPLGFNELNFSFDGNLDKVNLIISRCDDENLLLKVNGKDVLEMADQLIFYFRQLVLSKQMKLDVDDKSKVDELIKSLKEIK